MTLYNVIMIISIIPINTSFHIIIIIILILILIISSSDRPSRLSSTTSRCSSAAPTRDPRLLLVSYPILYCISL